MSAKLSLDKSSGFFEKAAASATVLAERIDNIDVANQVDLLHLQQDMAMYTNGLSMMTNIAKGLTDEDKEIIHNS